MGIIAEGAHADILVWDGDLEDNLDLPGDPVVNPRPIMKGGRVSKEEHV